jgi:threonine dehydrogenase-like Zn-dependent dehydrogenase
MNKMKQLWYTNKAGQKLRDRVELREMDIPKITAPGQIKVKIAYAALCATDIHMMTQGVFGAQPPMPLGHEASAVIVEVGAEAGKYGFKIGDKVVMTPASSCGMCAMCKKGLRQYCLNVTRSRTFAEYAVVDISAVFKIPNDADMRDYALRNRRNARFARWI